MARLPNYGGKWNSSVLRTLLTIFFNNHSNTLNQELVLPASDPLLLQVASDDILFGVVTAIHRCTCLFLP